MNQFLQDLLLIKSVNVDQIYLIVKYISFPILSAAFIMGSIYENLSTQNFVGLFKRLMVALFLISFGSSLLKSTVNLSFDISGRILDSVKNTNPIVQLIDRARKISTKNKKQNDDHGLKEKVVTTAKGLWESQAFVSKLLFDDGISSIVFIFSYAALMFLGQLYTIAYNFSYVSIPLLASLIVFPPTYSVANSITRTICWVFLMPIFTTITILLISNSFSFPQDGTNIYYFMSMENLINFCIMAIMLLFVPTIVSGFLSGVGVLTAAETFTKTTVTAALTGGKSLVLGGAKNTLEKVVFGKNFGLSTLAKVGVSKGLDRLGKKSIEARSRIENSKNSFKSENSNESVSKIKNQENTRNTFFQNNLKSSGQGKLSKTMDRSIIAADNVFNFKKNYVANKSTQSQLRSLGSSAPQRGSGELFARYKEEAHRSFRPLRPIDHQVLSIKNKSSRDNFQRMKYKKPKSRGVRV